MVKILSIPVLLTIAGFIMFFNEQHVMGINYIAVGLMLLQFVLLVFCFVNEEIEIGHKLRMVNVKNIIKSLKN